MIDEASSAELTSAEPWANNAGLAEARRNRTNLSTLPRRNNGFEDRGSHQTPFASSESEKNADDNIVLRYRTRVPTKNPFTFNPGLRPVRPPFEMWKKR